MAVDTSSDEVALRQLLALQQQRAASAYSGLLAPSYEYVGLDQAALAQGQSAPISDQIRRLAALNSLLLPSSTGLSLPSGFVGLVPQGAPLRPYDTRLQPSLAHSALGNVGGVALSGLDSTHESALAAARLEGFQLGSRMRSALPLSLQARSQIDPNQLGGRFIIARGLAPAASYHHQDLAGRAHLNRSQELPTASRVTSAYTGPTSSRPPVLLSRPEDPRRLSEHQVLLRAQIEAFEATEDDISTHTRGRNKPIQLGQVGIRCKHCAHLPVARRQRGSTYFPASLIGLYQAAQNMSTTHMQCGLCTEMPESLKRDFVRLMATKMGSSGAGRPYWAESARQLGLVDTEDRGIRFASFEDRGR